MPKNLTLQETSDYIVKSGKSKISGRNRALLLQGFTAGLCIAFGAIGYFKVASYAADAGVGIFLASAVFPIGIIAILLLGAELFTSDCMMIMGVYKKQYSIWQTLRVLTVVLFANLLGMIFMGGLTSLSGIFSEPMAAKIISLSEIKTALPISQLLFSAILCNLIVCTAIWLAYTIKDMITKITVLWFMITIFVLSGTEHIVANMYYLITAYFLGAQITIGAIAYNFLFVTIGNFIGGAIIVTGINLLTISAMSKQKQTS